MSLGPVATGQDLDAGSIQLPAWSIRFSDEEVILPWKNPTNLLFVESMVGASGTTEVINLPFQMSFMTMGPVHRIQRTAKLS